MDAAFCVDCLEDALRKYGKPEISNSDQGSQFTSRGFTEVLKREEVSISMDGRGRALFFPAGFAHLSRAAAQSVLIL